MERDSRSVLAGRRRITAENVSRRCSCKFLLLNLLSTRSILIPNSFQLVPPSSHISTLSRFLISSTRGSRCRRIIYYLNLSFCLTYHAPNVRLYLEMRVVTIFPSLHLSLGILDTHVKIYSGALRPKSEVALATRAERSCGFRGRRGIYAPFKPRPR